MYLDHIAALIRSHVPSGRMPDANSDELFRIYAVLLRAKGTSVSQSDVHDAWSAWMMKSDPNHAALVEYDDLPKEIRDEDRFFVNAVRRAAEQLHQSSSSSSAFSKVLFPAGPPNEVSDVNQALDLYKIMVQSSESLVGRRQGVNTFFLTMNGALLTASGLIVQGARGNRLGGLGIAVLAVAGAILCGAWRSLITSFGQLNRGKFRVINTIEKHLAVAIYAAEWEALGRGEDTKVYRSFTSREIWVPTALLTLHVVTAIVALLVTFGLINLGGGAPGT